MFLLLTPSRGHGAHYRRRQAARRLPGCLSCTTPPQDFDPADLVYCQSINAYTKGNDEIKLNFKEDDPPPENLEPLKISMAPLTCVQALDSCYSAIGTDNMCIPFNMFFSAEVRKLITQWKIDCRAAIKEEADKLRSDTQKVAASPRAVSVPAASALAVSSGSPLRRDGAREQAQEGQEA